MKTDNCKSVKIENLGYNQENSYLCSRFFKKIRSATSDFSRKSEVEKVNFTSHD